MKGPRIDLSNLPEEYVTAKFREYAEGVVYQAGTNSYNGGCPVCREGKSWGRKRRCWWSPSSGYIHCFNCGETWSPIRFIREATGMTTREICDEIRSGMYYVEDLDRIPPPARRAPVDDIPALPDGCVDLSCREQLDFYGGNATVRAALDLVHRRRLDTAVNRPRVLYACTGDDLCHGGRLVIPFYDTRGVLAFYQSRSLGAESAMPDVRYLSMRGVERTLFNVDRVRPDVEDVYVFEGPLDACFAVNGVAVAGISAKGGADLGPAQADQASMLELEHRLVWVPDSQWLDATAREKTAALLKSGAAVFCWPREIGMRYKDANDYCVGEGVDEFPAEILRANVATGPAALVRYGNFDPRSDGERAMDVFKSAGW